MGQSQERLTDLGAKLTRDQEQLDAAVKQHAVEKSVFGVNFQGVSESVDALQRAIVLVSARSDANGMALLQRQSKTETAMHRVRLPFSKNFSLLFHPVSSLEERREKREDERDKMKKKREERRDKRDDYTREDKRRYQERRQETR